MADDTGVVLLGLAVLWKYDAGGEFSILVWHSTAPSDSLVPVKCLQFACKIKGCVVCDRNWNHTKSRAQILFT